MSNSKLVKVTKISPNKNSPRNHVIDTITIHCVVGQLSARTMCDMFADPNYQASCNYCIGTSGEVGLIVEEKDRSWCSSSYSNDNRAITIECASDKEHPYAINGMVYDTLINLLVDICERNKKNQLIWFGDKEKTLSYTPKNNEIVMTVHRWFKNKACPGDYIYNRLAKIASDVTKRLNEKKVDTPGNSLVDAESKDVKYSGKWKATQKAYLRKGPGSAHELVSTIKKDEVMQCYGYYTKNKAGNVWILVQIGKHTGFVYVNKIKKC